MVTLNKLFKCIYFLNITIYKKGNDTCKEGYQGILCEECKFSEGFTKNRSGECNKCAS